MNGRIYSDFRSLAENGRIHMVLHLSARPCVRVSLFSLPTQSEEESGSWDLGISDGQRFEKSGRDGTMLRVL